MKQRGRPTARLAASVSCSGGARQRLLIIGAAGGEGYFPARSRPIRSLLSAQKMETLRVNGIKLRTALFVMALAGMLTPALLSAQNAGKETGGLPETKAPSATSAGQQAAPATAQTAPATPETTASGHPNDDYWRKHDQLMLTDFPWLARFKEEDLALGPPAAGESRVVFMGDSITQGWHLDGRRFPGKPTSIAASAGRPLRRWCCAFTRT